MSIKIENLSYTYAPGSAYEIHALKNLNLEIEEGDSVSRYYTMRDGASH